MNTINISTKLDEVTYLVNAFTGQEPLNPETSIGIGSGVTINDNGDILTAAHVVAGRLPVREKDLKDPNVIVLAKTKLGQFIQYYPVICGPSFQNEFMQKPITIDLAVLRPLSPQKNVPHLTISTAPVKVGTQILMAGFPDDMELPFSFDQILDKRNPEVQPVLPHISLMRQLLMIKSGMIGHLSKFTLSDNKFTVEGEIFYVDNQLHSGASGGPVVDQNAEIIGIITQRAITSVPYKETPSLKVPSGSTVAISARTIQPFITR